MSDLAVFFPEARIVETRSGPVSILPLTMAQLPGFAREINPAMAAILMGAWQHSIEQNGEALQKAVAIATRQTGEFIAGLYPDDFLRLTDAVLEVNLDFFGRSVLPQAAQVSQRLTAMIRPAGPTSLPGLSPEDTARPN